MAKSQNKSNWRIKGSRPGKADGFTPNSVTHSAVHVSGAGGNRQVQIVLTGDGNHSPSELCPELDASAIREKLDATPEMQQYRAAAEQLKQTQEDRAEVSKALREVMRNLAAPDAAKDLGELRLQKDVLASIEAELTAAAAASWDAAQRRLREIEAETKQAIFVEATSQKNEALAGLGPAIASVLDRITEADTRIKRAGQGSTALSHHGKGANQRAYTPSSYDHLLGNRPEVGQAHTPEAAPAL